MPLELVPVPCLKDNYAYLVHDPATGATGVVDVPEAGPILAELARREWRLTDIFLTKLDVLTGINNLDIGKGLQAGLAIVILAIVIDRISQAFAVKGTGRPARQPSFRRHT